MTQPNQNSRLLDSALATHWAITREGLDSLAAIYFLAASRTEKITGEALQAVIDENEALGHSLHLQSLDALETVKAEKIQGTGHAHIYENGIAVIDLIGPIFPRAGLMTMSSGLSIAQFTQDFVKVEAMSSVAGVVINIDSPGGDVRGIGDAARVINAVTRQSKKPIKAFVSGYMASAAYYVGSAVGKHNIISTESGLIGSIGVVLTAKSKGKDEIEVVSSQSPYKRPDGTTEEGRAVMQEQVDDLAEIFVRDVAKYRGESQAKVLSDYGQGKVYVAPRALKQGLVDSIGTLEQVVEQMASGTMTRRNRTKTSDTASVESLLQFTEDENDMALKSIIDRFRASSDTVVEGLEPEAGPDAIAAGADTEPNAVAEAPLTPEAPVAADDAVANDLEASAQAQRPSREELEERFSDAAELFATQMTVDSKVFPAQSAYAASDLLAAKIDDALVGGSIKFVDEQGQLAEGTREAAVRARYMAMPKHTMTQKAIAGIKDGSVAASVLAETDRDTTKDEPTAPERRAQLLAGSSVGQAVLNAQNK